jgi:hypothetical protein
VDLVPTLGTSGFLNDKYLLNIDPRYGSVFNVDLGGLSTNNRDIGTCLNAFGQITTSNNVPVVSFAIIVNPIIASSYPGMEFTVNFQWSEGVNIRTCVRVWPNPTVTEEYDGDLVSPQYSYYAFYNTTLTLRSNGSHFTVVSSGPVSWSSYFNY